MSREFMSVELWAMRYYNYHIPPGPSSPSRSGPYLAQERRITPAHPPNPGIK